MKDDDEGTRRDELNIIMDNCAGQNKNRMVLRLAPLLVELEEYGTCNMIFLVAGHTKNAADRLFNLLKKEYRQNNIYNMSMLIDKLNQHRLIDAIKVEPEDFRNWDEFLNSIYVPMPGGVVKNYQFFQSSLWRPGWMQAQLSSSSDSEGIRVDMRNTKIGEEERKVLLSKPFDINDRVAMITPPGVRAIKQCEMYNKWQQFIPAEHITDIYKQPDEDIVNELKDDKQKKRLFLGNKEASSSAAKVVATAPGKRKATTTTKTTKTTSTTTKKAPAKRKAPAKKQPPKRQQTTKKTKQVTKTTKKTKK
jgi:hypothetical protein